MVVLITGINGFLGSSLTSKLLENGDKVIGIDINHTDRTSKFEINKNFMFIKAGYDDYPNIEINEPIDAFVHLAWIGVSGTDYLDINKQINNIVGAINLLNLANKVNAKKFIFIDSSHEYQKNKNSKNKLGYCSIYGAAKKSTRCFLDTIGHNLGIDIIGVAFTNVYGFGDYSFRSANSIICNIMKNSSADLIEGTHLHDWTYITDAINGIIAVLNKGIAGKTYYIGSRNLITFKEIVEKVKNSINPNAILNFGTYKDSAYIDYSFFDLNLAYEDTGFESKISVEEGSKLTLDWLKKINRI